MPLRQKDIRSAIELVRWIQNKNHRAYLSHRKKQPYSLSCVVGIKSPRNCKTERLPESPEK
jgi:hypothetical protein